MAATKPRRGPGRPPRPGGPDPTRSLRVGPIWEQALELAGQRGESLSAIVTRALADYVRQHSRGS